MLLRKRRTVSDVMRCAMVFGVMLCAVTSGSAQDARSDDVTRAIKEYFKQSPAELSRYGGLTLYGETISNGTVSKETIDREAALLKDAIAAGMLKSPPDEVLALGHNLVVHDPTKGEAYLKAIHENTEMTEERVSRNVFATTLAAGDFGERLAVAELTSPNQERRALWARYLEQAAIDRASAPPIEKQIDIETDAGTKVSLLRALALIGMPESLECIRRQVETAKTDDVQAAAIYAYVELAGFDGIAYIEKTKAIGPKAIREREDGLTWLKKSTSAEGKHGREVTGDQQFIDQFGDLYASPAIRWLASEHLLEAAAVKNPPSLDAARKKALLDALVESRGFGLEAAKGALFKGLVKSDEEPLLRMRAAGFYSPNGFSNGRMKTIGIMLRRIRQGA